MTELWKTQLRKGVLAHLDATVDSLKSVVPAVRAERVFQSDDLPLATVQIADVAVPVGGNPAAAKAIRHNVQAVIQVAHHADVDDVEDLLEAIQLDVQAALADSAKFGVSGVHNWLYGGSSPTATTNVGLAVLTLNYTCWLTTAPGQANKII